jgi:hypothetical protein
VPVQRYNTEPVERPTGLVPPALPSNGLIELRVHGVGGTTPEDLLADLAPQQVSGDRIAGFYRTADLPRDGQRLPRRVEAYSWGGLTSRSAWRVLWVLLFPFALANVAGWMCARRVHQSPRWFSFHRAMARLSALALTLNLLLFIAMTSMDLVAYQCGGQRSCAGNSTLLRFLRWPSLADYPTRRILVGALIPFGVVLILAVLTWRSIGRYEHVRPPFKGEQAPVPPATSAAAANLGLQDQQFWDGQASARSLGMLHVAAGFAFVALVATGTVQNTLSRSGLTHPAGLQPWIPLLLGAVALALSVIIAMFNSCPTFVAVGLVAAAGIACVLAVWFALAQPRMTQGYGALPGMNTTIDLTFTGILAPMILIFLVSAWPRRGTSGQSRQAKPVRDSSDAESRNAFRWLGPFVVVTVAAITLNAVMVGTMIRIADWLGTISLRGSTGTASPAETHGQPTLYFSPVVGRLTPYLVLGPLALVVVFALIAAVTHLRIPKSETAAIRKLYTRRSVEPGDHPDDPVFARPHSENEAEKAWQYTTVAAPGRNEHCEDGRSERWIASVARARRIARIPREADLLLSTMAAGTVLMVVILVIRSSRYHHPPWATSWMITTGSWVAAWLPVLVILLLRSGWGNLTARRHIGVLWDVLTFWPRAYHPLAPPSYAERAVPELQRRLWFLHDSGARTMVAAHSQGAIIAAAALVQDLVPTTQEGSPPEPEQTNVALVTFGAPLRTLYGWAFPAYFNGTVFDRLAGPTRVRTWRNLYYETDYIGRDVLEAVDKELPDPITCWYIYGQPRPAPGSHSGYWSDPRFWTAVDSVAQELSPAGESGPASGAQERTPVRVEDHPTDALAES